MNKFISVCIFVAFTFGACTTTTSISSGALGFSYPHDGVTNNAVLAVKDYIPVQIIFVKSSETVDGDGNHTGSKITYEMLMLEAQKLGADDVINIKIDVKQKEEKTEKNGYTITVTTYDYTASALAVNICKRSARRQSVKFVSKFG